MRHTTRSLRFAAASAALVATIVLPALTASAKGTAPNQCAATAGASAATIQAEVEACAGRVVTLAAGTYDLTDHVVLDRPVTIDGAGSASTFLVQESRINIFQVTAPGVTVENLNVNTATYNPGVPPQQKNPVPATIYSSQSNTHVINVTSEAGFGFGMRFTGPRPCESYPTTGTVITNVISTNTGTGGFTALDIDCTNGAILTNVTIHGDYIAFYEDENVTMNGETYTAGPYEAGMCGADWYVSGPANAVTLTNIVTHNGKGIARNNRHGIVTNLSITGETFTAGDACTRGL